MLYSIHPAGQISEYQISKKNELRHIISAIDPFFEVYHILFQLMDSIDKE